ncbi:probable 4-coumarate--CoA ligase 1 [Diaphorina citri]|uniref:Probable 4-coumarate--CoA ligase 1 n=1 Tax=Diaphorina citri TaxID=121845 RepID=A0A1S3CUC3_DIACI|nr:probable 4-coumarate--CoA ligase 1 [Diaphorina citri]
MSRTIIDPVTSVQLPDGKTGELCLKGDVFLGYRNKVEATKEMLDDDGWLHTGDLAYRLPDGTHFIIDRLLLINENINTIDTVGDEEPLLIKIREYEKEIEEISNAEPQVEQLTMKLTAAYENRKPIIEQIEEVKQDIAAIRKKKSSLSSKELHEKIESLKKEMLNELDHLRAKIDNVYNESNLSHQEEMPCEASISVDESIRKGDE